MAKENRPEPTIAVAEIRDALRRSGYLLEYRVERLLDQEGFLTDPNAAYPDPLTGKSREVDVCATKISWSTAGHSLRAELLIECVNNPQPIAFFMRDQGGPSIGNAYLCHISGAPTGVPVAEEEEAWTPLFSFLDVEEFHPYCNGPVATQFCSFQKKKQNGDWLAFHDEQHFDSARKLCHVVDHRVEADYRATAEDMEASPEERSRISLAVYWPIIVVQGGLLEVRPEAKGLGIRRVKRTRLQMSTATEHATRQYQMDLVVEDSLSHLLDEIGNAMAALQSRIVDHRDELVAAVRRLSTDALAQPADGRWRTLAHNW